jgi:hypothetical protein
MNHSPHFKGPAFYARRAATTTPEQLQALARWEIHRRLAYAKLNWQGPLRIRVFKAQGKRLLVLRIGAKFVSAFTWEALTRKAAWGPWKDIRSVTLFERWK